MNINARLGHYDVNGHFFTEKVHAVLKANETKSNIRWVFNDDVFDRVNWQIEPPLSIDDYYRIRAQQIRDEFDYVVLMVSGGGDSRNVVWSFLNNNIKVDEIYASAPISGLKNWKASNTDTHADNNISETFFAQIPLLQEIRTHDPNLKITFNDYFQHMLNYKTDDWLLTSGAWIHPSANSRYRMDNLTHLVNLAESGKKIAFVYGIDKPTLIIRDDQFYGRITDNAVNTPRSAFTTPYSNVENVLFYYARELPELMVKQYHILLKWISRSENLHVKDFLLNNKTKHLVSEEQHRIRNSHYQQAIMPCIYPSTFKPVFQCHKATRLFFAEHDSWFYKLHGNTKLYQLIDSDFRNFYKSIDKSYLNGSGTSFKMFDKTFKIG